MLWPGPCVAKGVEEARLDSGSCEGSENLEEMEASLSYGGMLFLHLPAGTRERGLSQRGKERWHPRWVGPNLPRRGWPS